MLWCFIDVALLVVLCLVLGYLTFYLLAIIVNDFGVIMMLWVFGFLVWVGLVYCIGCILSYLLIMFVCYLWCISHCSLLL